METHGINGITKKRERTAERIIQALGETQGLLTLAARKAGVSYRTINRYAGEYPSVQKAVRDAKSSTLDFAESKLFQAIRKGNLTAIIFYLKTQGKIRGYIERNEIIGGEGTPLIPPAVEFHFADGTVLLPPRNGHKEIAGVIVTGDDGDGHHPPDS